MKTPLLKTALLVAGLTASFGGELNAQGCAITGTSGLHGYGCGVGDMIEYYELDGISNSSFNSCPTNAYIMYNSPTWNLTIGNTYTWSAITGSIAGYSQGLAIWIDLNNDGNFSSAEQMGNSSPSITHAGTFSVPFSATPASNVRMRLRCDYFTTIGNTNQTACEIYGPPNYNFYYGETEDYLVNLISPVPCTATPGANAVVTPTAPICPNSSAFLYLMNTYTVGDITYSWEFSDQSAVGPFTAVPTGTNSTYSTPSLTNTTWYRVILTCTNVTGQTVASVGAVSIAPNSFSTVPYLETFEGIGGENILPNCSWFAPSLGSSALTYTSSNTLGRWPRSGNNFASFYYSPGGETSFYTNGIWMDAGVTYSATMWFQTDYYGSNNWPKLEMYAGPTQTNSGQFLIAATSGPAISSSYKSLTNTFTVGTSGYYYVEIRATSDGNGGADWLSWDDLSIIVPCDLNPVTIGITPNINTPICQGQSVQLVATGADTYVWNTTATGSVITVSPQGNTTYMVTGTAKTKCIGNAAIEVTVNPTPPVGIFVDKPEICAGESVNLTAYGATSYTWSTPSNNVIITETPATTTTYSLIGQNQYGCTKEVTQPVIVKQAPAITIGAVPTTICAGDVIALNATGGTSYQWSSMFGMVSANPYPVMPMVNASYTVTGTGSNGCKGNAVASFIVTTCTGVDKHAAGGLTVFPNPGPGVYQIGFAGEGKRHIAVIDLTGRKVLDATTTASSHELNLANFAAGVYYLQIEGAGEHHTVKLIKN
jgi:hypothetical protein